LTNESVMLNVRTEAKENRRTVVTSKDGATHWSQPHFQEDLPDAICFGEYCPAFYKKRRGPGPTAVREPG